MYKLTLPVTIAILSGLAAPLSFAAGNSAQEISTARTHAQYAATATDRKTADMHLHNVINCLVGTDGKGYDASVGDPCEGMGNGALNDVQNNATKKKLDHALALANKGLHASTLATARHDAKWALKTLKGVRSDNDISG